MGNNDTKSVRLGHSRTNSEIFNNQQKNAIKCNMLKKVYDDNDIKKKTNFQKQELSNQNIILSQEGGGGGSQQQKNKENVNNFQHSLSLTGRDNQSEKSSKIDSQLKKQSNEKVENDKPMKTEQSVGTVIEVEQKPIIQQQIQPKQSKMQNTKPPLQQSQKTNKVNGNQKNQSQVSQSLQNIKIINENCLQQKLFSLPLSIQSLILKFLMNDYLNLTLVSPFWYIKVHEIIQNDFTSIDNKFIQKYLEVLSFQNSYLSYTPINISKKKGFRLDWNIEAEILPKVLGSSVTLSYTYQSQKNKQGKAQKYKCEFKFDAIQEKNRVIWAYKEECKHNYDENKMAFIQPIIPVRCGDNIKLAINFYNLNGLFDYSTIEWKTPKFTTIPKIPIHLDPNNLESYDKNRICEIEEIYSGWVLYNYFDKSEKVTLDEFEPQLQLLETRCSGVDIVTSKLIYQAKQKGQVKGALNKLGLNITILEQKDQITAEVKKMGVFYDLENKLEVRVGDTLIIYISKGD